MKIRVAELRAKAVKPTIATVIRRKEHATGIMENTDASHRDQLAANRLIGEYERDLGPSTAPVPTGPTFNFSGVPMELLTLLHEMYKSGALQAFMESRPEFKALGDGKSVVEGKRKDAP